MFLSYMPNIDIPFAVATNLTYGREYEAVLRQAFSDILFMYPKETLRTFYYYKPRMILSSLEQLASINLRVSPVLIVLFIASFANLVAFALVSPLGSTRNGVIAGATVLFVVFSTIPYIAVWAMPHTSGDLLCFCM